MKGKKQVEALRKQFQVAVTLHQAGKLDEAFVQYKKLLNFLPDNPELLTSIATIAFQKGRLEEGLRLTNKSLQINGNQPHALNNLGNALRFMARSEEALASYNRAIEIQPDFAEAYSNRGILFLDLKRLDEALVSFERAIALNPYLAEAYFNQGNTFKDLKRLNEALTSYDRSLALTPLNADVHCNRGSVLKDLNRLDEALVSYDQAIAANPGHDKAHANRGLALQELKRLDEALCSFERAIALNPNSAEAYWNLSLLKILNGEYEEGWRLYEWRWKLELPVDKLRIYSQPQWSGEQSLSNKVLLIYPEQGFGDYILFVRYVALVEQLGARVILEAPLPLMPVISTLSGEFTLLEPEQPLPDFDYHCPIMSLPLAFKTTVETIPAPSPYLYVDAHKQAIWRQRLGEKANPRVGLVWSGSTDHVNDHNRSIALKQFQALWDLPIEFHSLQIEYRSDDAQLMSEIGGIITHEDSLDDFSDTAALLEEMDLVISVDTSVAHLAGALGKQVWILLPFAPDYRWMLDRRDSLWYPTATLFRQTEYGNWDGVIKEVRRCLLEAFSL